MPGAYVVGVEMAKERYEARLERSVSRFEALFDCSAKALAPSLKEAKERAERRKAKYLQDARMVKFIAVPRGSKPLLALEIDEAFKAAGDKPTTVDDATEAKEGE